MVLFLLRLMIDNPLLSFNGITGNSSFENGRLKMLFRELFDFDLILLQNNEYKEASIETMFLPYYISQSVGWVSIRKTFDGLEFYRNFKEDFLDYYLGINKSEDIVEEIKLETERKALQTKKEILNTTIQNDMEIVLANLESDTIKSKCAEYIVAFNNQANELLYTNIEVENGKILSRIDDIEKELKGFKSIEDISNLRFAKQAKFKSLFISYLYELGVKYTSYSEEDRFFDLYKISALPYQGVELLKAMMAYHFAFNNLIKSNAIIHRFPFLLDAIFKEDIDEANKKLILEFIKNYHPEDTQLIFSMADKIEGQNQISDFNVNKDYYNNLAVLIHVSDNERSMLKDWDSHYDDLQTETIAMMDGN